MVRVIPGSKLKPLSDDVGPSLPETGGGQEQPRLPAEEQAKKEAEEQPKKEAQEKPSWSIDQARDTFSPESEVIIKAGPKKKKSKPCCCKSCISSWPTMWVDICAQLPLLVLSLFLVFPGVHTTQRRTWDKPWTWDKVDYMASVKADRYLQWIFALWTFETLLTLGIVAFHGIKKHHPKFYATKCNRISIVAHIIGGSVAIFGSYFGFVLGSKEMIMVAMVFGVFLHFPSAMWQSRNLYGSRELMQATYYTCNACLLVKYLDVVTENANAETVMAMGLCLGIFALVRFFYSVLIMLQMDVLDAYNRSCLMAVVVNMPFCFGHFGVLIWALCICFWNLLINLCFDSSMRKLMKVNRSYNDVLPNRLNGRPVQFAKTFVAFRKKYPDPREAVARTVFSIVAADDEYITLPEMEKLVENWGIADAASTAASLFAKADSSADGRIEYGEYEKHLSFIWERVYGVGELGEEGKIHSTSWNLQNTFSEKDQ